jgi:hypothetical protein
MAHSLIGADRMTQLRIVGVALIAVLVFVTVGVAAHWSDFETAAAMMQNRSVVVKAAKPDTFSTRYDVVIR